MSNLLQFLQAPADLSKNGQFLLPPSSPTRHGFLCRMCGGGDFCVETRRFFEVEISSLRLYQEVAIGDFPETLNILTCARCAAVTAEAYASIRDVLVRQLVTASRSLAENQFCRPASLLRNGRFELQCVECRTVQRSDDHLDHVNGCRTGRVLGLLASLRALPGAQDGERDKALSSGSGSPLTRSPKPAAKTGGAQ